MNLQTDSSEHTERLQGHLPGKKTYFVSSIKRQNQDMSILKHYLSSICLTIPPLSHAALQPV